MSNALRRQAERLYRVFAELVRQYQFRDREEVCCHGLSVSQCHTLEALAERGPMTMGELANLLHLENSTVTRLVDGLVKDQLATRAADARDRRVCRVRPTARGRALLGRIRAELIAEHEAVLREVPAGSRESVISAMARLLSAFEERQRCSAARSQSACGEQNGIA